MNIIVCMYGATNFTMLFLFPTVLSNNSYNFETIYSASSLIRTALIRILAYPNSQKQDYNIIHKHFIL